MDWQNKATRMAIDAIRDEAIDECVDLVDARALATIDQDIANALARMADDLDALKSAGATRKR